ncbi:unnamed protein product [Staurois parvus]|uniref:Uncharacterized protein n=1 Tax=Staurois parvus TaxID=386267 RepID=A0ABN9AS87_9NEOB|nr:unnamed protein product [Staurois parvus]
MGKRLWNSLQHRNYWGRHRSWCFLTPYCYCWLSWSS